MRTVSTHCKKMLCKISRSEVHGLRSVWHGYQTGIGCVFLSMCVFLYTRVFYHCPTTSVAPRLENTCRPGRKFFHFQNHYRPCVDHNAVRATLDAVHRVTVLCAVLCTLSHIRDHLGVFGLCCATLLVLCDCVPLCCTHPLLCCALCLLCCVCLFPHAGGGGW
jgi:hypothetical protein